MNIFKDLEPLKFSEKQELSTLAELILSGQLDVLHGGCAIYKIVKQNNIDRLQPFKYLWALADDCSELPMNESERFGRHPDLLKRLDVRLEELAAGYRAEVLSTCRVLNEALPPAQYR